jgi:hypothetical protein
MNTVSLLIAGHLGGRRVGIRINLKGNNMYSTVYFLSASIAYKKIKGKTISVNY